MSPSWPTSVARRTPIKPPFSSPPTTARASRNGCAIWFPFARRQKSQRLPLPRGAVRLRPRRIWSLLAAPAADAVIADCGHLDISDDQALLDPDLFCPGIRNMGTFTGAAILASPHPLCCTTWPKALDRPACVPAIASRRRQKSKAESRLLNDAEIANSLPEVAEIKSY